MTKEQYNKIFEETAAKLDERYSDENLLKIVRQYCDSNGNLSLPDLAMFCFIESNKKSVYFMHELLKNFVELEEGE